jgi:hypothetical protein
MGEQSNIVGLVPKPKPDVEPSQPLIQFLEELLEQAKTGELRGMSGATRFQDDDCTYFVMGWAGGFAMTGALHTALLSQSNVLDDFE